jgi:hypothetical protein
VLSGLTGENQELTLISLSIWNFEIGSTDWAALQAMDESLPERPPLFFDFVLPFRSKDLFTNFWIADSHGTTPTSNGFENSEGLPQNNPD